MLRLIKLSNYYSEHVREYTNNDCDTTCLIPNIGMFTSLKRDYNGFGKYYLNLFYGDEYDNSIGKIINEGYRLYTNTNRSFGYIFMTDEKIFIVIEKYDIDTD